MQPLSAALNGKFVKRCLFTKRALNESLLSRRYLSWRGAIKPRVSKKLGPQLKAGAREEIVFA